MQYTVCSGGRPIGVTDLGFVYRWNGHRSGWFHPNADGERLMPIVTGVLPAVRACDRRQLSADEPDLRQTTEGADLAEALHHAASLDLTLHLEDGTLVPVEFIGLQDMEQLLALNAEAEREQELRGEPSWAEPELSPEMEASIQHDLELIEQMQREAEEQRGPWAPDEEPTAFPRYQIHLRLADGVTLP